MGMSEIAIDLGRRNKKFCFENVQFAVFLRYANKKSSSQYISGTWEDNSILDIISEIINKKITFDALFFL